MVDTPTIQQGRDFFSNSSGQVPVRKLLHMITWEEPGPMCERTKRSGEECAKAARADALLMQEKIKLTDATGNGVVVNVSSIYGMGTFMRFPKMYAANITSQFP